MFELRSKYCEVVLRQACPAIQIISIPIMPDCVSQSVFHRDESMVRDFQTNACRPIHLSNNVDTTCSCSFRTLTRFAVLGRIRALLRCGRNTALLPSLSRGEGSGAKRRAAIVQQRSIFSSRDIQENHAAPYKLLRQDQVDFCAISSYIQTDRLTFPRSTKKPLFLLVTLVTLHILCMMFAMCRAFTTGNREHMLLARSGY